MKHTLKVTALLVGLFFLSQIVGLWVIGSYVDKPALSQGNVSFTELPYLERPQMEESVSLWYILGAIFVGTLFLLVIIHFKKVAIWKIWFFLSVLFCLTVALKAFMPSKAALAFAFVLALLKLFRPSSVIHNATEIFIYGGLAAIFVHVISVPTAFFLLLAISIYDMYAVWKSKHMVKIAEFSSDAKVFAGLNVSYGKSEKVLSTNSKRQPPIPSDKMRNAILGGGDMGFPLLFTGAVFRSLILDGFMRAFYLSLLISVACSIALLLLLMHGKKGRYYPAMPFMSLGCSAGWLAIYLLT